MFRNTLFFVFSFLIFGCEPKFNDDCQSKADCFSDEICVAGSCAIPSGTTPINNNNNTNNRTSLTSNTTPIEMPSTIEVMPSTGGQVAVGESLELVTEVKSASGKVLQLSPEWKSSAPLIATVSMAGVVTGKAVGAVEIIASIDAIETRVSVEVILAPVRMITIMPAAATIKKGSTATLVYEAKDKNGNTINGREAVWASSDESIAFIDMMGKVTALSLGEATITISIEEKVAEAIITVVNEPIATVEISPPSAEIAVGGRAQFTAVAKSAAGNMLPDRVFNWVSSDVNTASVDIKGEVTGKAPGTVMITVSSEGQTASATVIVKAVPVATVEIGPMKAFTVVQHTSLQLMVDAFDLAGQVIFGRTVTWLSSDEAIATIDSTGFVDLKMPGTITVTATIEGKTDSAQITIVAAPVASVTISSMEGSAVIDGETLQLTAELKDATGHVLMGRTVIWSSSATAIATVDGNGLVTGASIGVAQIHAISEGKQADYNILVEAGSVDSVVVTPAMATLDAVNPTVQLTVSLQDSQGNPVVDAISWTSSDANIVTVDMSGLVTRIGIGSATITATSDGQTGISTITVSN